MIIGYARVSTDDQRLDMQLTALKEAGCHKIFQDHGATGSNMDRPGMEAVIRTLGPGDTLVVWRLDRLGRSLTDLVQFIEGLGERGSEFRSLNEAIDTSTSGGRLIFHIMAAFAEFERNLISERTRAGLAAARKRGRRLGRPPKLLSDSELEDARHALQEQGQNIVDIATRYRISASTLRRRLGIIRATQSASQENQNYSVAKPSRTKSFRRLIIKLLGSTSGRAVYLPDQLSSQTLSQQWDWQAECRKRVKVQYINGCIHSADDPENAFICNNACSDCLIACEGGLRENERGRKTHCPWEIVSSPRRRNITREELWGHIWYRKMKYWTGIG